MGGKQKAQQAQTAALKRANQLKAQSLKTQAKNAANARRIAVRTAAADRRASNRQNAALVKAERQSAALLAQIGNKEEAAPDLRTEFIQDEEAARKKLSGISGSGAYGFSRPSGFGLGGGKSMLG
jgi:hypothetical protein